MRASPGTKLHRQIHRESPRQLYYVLGRLALLANYKLLYIHVPTCVFLHMYRIQSCFGRAGVSTSSAVQYVHIHVHVFSTLEEIKPIHTRHTNSLSMVQLLATAHSGTHTHKDMSCINILGTNIYCMHGSVSGSALSHLNFLTWMALLF